MRFRLKKLLSVLLCALLLVVLLPAPAGALTLTAVNDTLLPIDVYKRQPLWLGYAVS